MLQCDKNEYSFLATITNFASMPVQRLIRRPLAVFLRDGLSNCWSFFLQKEGNAPQCRDFPAYGLDDKMFYSNYSR